MFLSAYDIDPYTKGAGKDLGLHSQTLQEVSREYVTRRQQFKKTRLQWRKSAGVRRSLGWIPFKSGAVKWKSGQVYHNGHLLKVWDSYGLAQCRQGRMRSESISGSRIRPRVRMAPGWRPDASTVIWNRRWPRLRGLGRNPGSRRYTPKSGTGARMLCTNSVANW
ncbi:hypothetical protein MnBA_38690 [Marinobacterium sp. BA1]